MDNLENNQKSDATPMGYDTLLATGFVLKKRNPWNLGKRKPVHVHPHYL